MKGRAKLIRDYLRWARLPSDRYKERESAWQQYVKTRDGKLEKERALTHQSFTTTETSFREVTFTPNPSKKRRYH